MTVLTGPCRHTAIGGCITNPTSDDHACIYCGQVVDHARKRLAAALLDADPGLLAKARRDLWPWWKKESA